MSSKKDDVLSRLPENLHDVFELLVENYRFHSERVHGQAFVSYEVLAGLIEDGWRPADEPQRSWGKEAGSADQE